MKVLEASNITKQFPGVIALDDVSISFELGKIHCIVGENGAGKSTLLKILTGVYTPDDGEITIQGKNALSDKKMFEKVAYVPQEIDLFKYMTVAENLFMPFSRSGFKNGIINKKELNKKAIPYLKKFQITAKPNALVADISVSEQQLLQIARSTVVEESQIIILDEPTTSLTSKDTERLFGIIKQLKNENKGIIFISHKLEEVFALGDEISVMRNGCKVAYSEIKDVDIQWTIKNMTGRDIDEKATFHPSNVSKEVLLDVENLTGEIFTDVSFKLHRGEILGFSGLVGAGRSEIIQTIFGYLPAWRGTVTVEGKPWKLGNTNYSVNNGMMYIPEERKQQGIFSSLSVKENITMPLFSEVTNGLMISSKKENNLVDKVIQDYYVRTSSKNKEIKYLSGGNQQKVIIGRAMFCNPKILIFDEPTKGIDVSTKTEIYKLMKKLADEEKIGIILISSELEEIMKCSNRIITIYNGRKMGEFETSKVKNSTIINSIMGFENN